MSITSEVRQEISKLDEEMLAELLPLIRSFVAKRASVERPRLLARLSEIHIDAPPNLSSQLDRNELDDHG